MFDHVGLSVVDLEPSVRFYTAALAPLGFSLCSRDQGSAGFGPPDAPQLWLYQKGAGAAATHLAFRAKSRMEVQRFHAAALAAGGRDHGAPAVRADYSPDYYAAFVLDPDGNNLEAVCMQP
jgi:catechol 2,3-dioxygenase-like lactoylglutathione lyase family enzyme